MPFLAGNFRHDLLRQDIQRMLGNMYLIQFIALDCGQHGAAFHQIIPGQGKQASLGNGVEAMAGTAYAL